MPEMPDPLPPLLAAWRLNPPADPAFRAAVRARLAPARPGAAWVAFARRRTGPVLGAVLVALAAGAVGGHGSARARVAEDRARLAAAYVAGLDARLLAPVR